MTTAAAATQTTIPGTDPAQAAAPAAAVADPAAAAAVPAAAAPAAPAARRASAIIKIPQAAFKARVEREANAAVAAKLGVSLDEAARLMKIAQDAEKGILDTKAQTDTTVKTVREENESLKRRLAKATQANDEILRKNKREVRRLKDRQIDADLRFVAAKHGVKDTDYAIHLFAKAVRDGKATEPEAFFKGLKEGHPHLFGKVEPTVTTISPTTAPPASKAPGEVTPEPAATGTPRPPVDIDTMDNTQFAAHTRSKYGFSPGMG